MGVETDTFDEKIPQALQRNMLRAIVNGFMQARGAARMFRWERVKDTVVLRRLFVEERLGEILLDAEHHTATFRQTTSCTNWMLEANGLVITAISRSHSVDSVAAAPYRQTLADGGQLPLFHDAKPVGDRLYAVLLYGGRAGASLPEFVRVVFPDRTGHFLPVEIDLLDRYPEVTSALANHEPYVAVEVPPGLPVPAELSVDGDPGEIKIKLTLKKLPPQGEEDLKG